MVTADLLISLSVFQYEENRARNQAMRRKLINAHKDSEKWAVL